MMTPQFEEERRRNDSMALSLIEHISTKVDKLADQISELATTVNVLAAKQDKLDGKVTDHIADEGGDVRELKDMWRSAKGTVTAVKWLVAIAAGASAVIAAIKSNFHITLK